MLPEVKLISHTPDPLRHIEVQGREAYGSAPSSTDEGVERWIAARLRGWELDVLEHATVTWRITMSRVAAQEFTRHRIAAYTMQSMRFREPQLEDMHLVPPEIKDEDIEEWIADYEAAFEVYKKWRAKGYKRQTARYHLPVGSKTVLAATWNFRTMMHILHMRDSKMAQPEAQYIANKMRTILTEKWPIVFKEDIAA